MMLLNTRGLYGSLLGQAEQDFRHTLRVANATFFFNYPDQRQRTKIRPIYLRTIDLDPKQPKPDEVRAPSGLDEPIRHRVST